MVTPLEWCPGGICPRDRDVKPGVYREISLGVSPSLVAQTPILTLTEQYRRSTSSDPKVPNPPSTRFTSRRVSPLGYRDLRVRVVTPPWVVYLGPPLLRGRV